MAKERLTYNTPEVQAILDSVDGKASIEQGTTEYWNNRTGYVPPAGTIIVYNDYKSKEVDGETIYTPGIKIGSGNGYVQDLAFVDGDVSDALVSHINDTLVHIQSGEREFWNRKLNVDDNMEVVDETLIFNRL
jgi:hypothetical protein